jgi:muconolactone delta-isomerase
MRSPTGGRHRRRAQRGDTHRSEKRAESRAELDALLGALPLYEWMRVSVTPLEPHPNDPAAGRTVVSQP